MSGSNIALEGRTRLPGKVQDCIQDFGMIAAYTQAASRSNELLGKAFKIFVSLETAVEQSYANLRKMDALLDTMNVRCLSLSNKS